MRVVIDTNVLVSGLLSPFGASADIVRMVVTGELKVCFDARIISEYEEVLNRPKFSIPRHYVEDLIDYIRHSGYISGAKPLAQELPDRDDEAFLEIALSSAASYLITGNIRHYPARLRYGVKVITPSEFLKEFSK